MNINEQVYLYRVKAKGFDEKTEIIRNVAKELGRNGIKEFARLVGVDPSTIEKSAGLTRYFKDKNRVRRQRKPKQWVPPEAFIVPEIEKQKLAWGMTIE